jgi:N-acetylglucosamine kinase-like BadF-type ATPase
MKAQFIVADAGGTSTKWAIYKGRGEVVTFETASLHPRNILDEGQLIEALKQSISEMNIPLYFYGAGCGSDVGKAKVTNLLERAGFEHAIVESDILGACRGTCGNSSGFVAILGTGSICVEYDGKHIINRYGGYGPMIGDEGSGFHFGKLCLKYALNAEVWSEEMVALFQTKQELLGWLQLPDLVTRLSQLAKKTSSVTFEFLHEQNLHMFFNEMADRIPAHATLHLSGSYGFFKKDVVQKICKDRKLSLGNCIQNPLESLVAFHSNDAYNIR